MCKQLINNQFYLSLLAASFSPSGLEMDKKCPNWWCLWGVWKVSGRCLEGVWMALDIILGVIMSCHFFISKVQ